MKKETKKQQKKKKLELRKETLRELTSKELDRAAGGITQAPQPTATGHCGVSGVC